MSSTKDLMYDLETDILNKVANYLVKGEIDKYSSQWQLEKLKELGGMNADIQKLIKNYKPKINKQTKADIDKTVNNVFKDLRERLPNSKDNEIRMTPELQNQIDTWLRSADNDINISMAKMAEKASEQYVQALNKASLSVITGQSTLRDAVKSAVIETANNGLPAYKDKAGRFWSPEGYSQMVIRSNQRRVATETMINSGKQIDADRVEISSHIGARPKCAPYQGRIMTWEKLYNNTSWGEPDGLNGINCGHFFYPFKDGMTQRYKPYPEKQNETVYNQSQQQRKLERAIRDSKRKTKIYTDKGLDNKVQYYKQKSRDNQKKLRDFISDTGRTRRNDREQIYQ